MAQKKIKVVLDADVIIHFAKGQRLSWLPNIFPEFEFVVLDIVLQEVKQPTLHQLQSQIALLKNIREIKFGETAEERREFARLTSVEGLGRGESACMAYCRFNHHVVGSSNLRDISAYCETYQITYLTTIDFLYYAIQRKLISIDEANNFIISVNAQGSNLPQTNFEDYFCDKI